MTPPLSSNAAVLSSESPLQRSWNRLLHNRMAVGSLIFLVIMASLCFLAPLIAPYNYEAQNLAIGATPPSAEHWFGTDTLGRDLLSRMLYGGRISFGVGLLAAAVSIGIGVSYGMISGFAGGLVDRIMMRIVDIIYPLPFVIFVILLVTLFGREIWLIFVAIGAVEWLTMARIIRGQVTALRHQQFVEAGKALGRRSFGLLRKHILPNIFGTIVVYATLTIPAIMLLEALISFLGLGVQAPMTSWGDLINNGAENMEEHPWLLLYPSLFFSATLFSLNFLGDGLREAFDPRSIKQ